MTQAIEQLASELGELLANSMLDKRIKKAILDNLDTLPEDLVFKLRDALQKEHDSVDGVISDIEMFLNKQDGRWAKLEEEQKKTAETMGDEIFEKLKDQI